MCAVPMRGQFLAVCTLCLYIWGCWDTEELSVRLSRAQSQGLTRQDGITAPPCRVKRRASRHGAGTYSVSNLARCRTTARRRQTRVRLPDRSYVILQRVDLQIAGVSSHWVSKPKNTLLEDRCGYRLQVTFFSVKHASCFIVV